MVASDYDNYKPDVYMIFDNPLVNQIYQMCEQDRIHKTLPVVAVVYGAWFLLILLTNWLWKRRYDNLRKKSTGKRTIFLSVLLDVLAGLVCGAGISLIYGYHYLYKNFGDVAFGTLLYHLNTPLTGTNVSSFGDIIGVVTGILVAAILVAVLLGAILRKCRMHAGVRSFLTGAGVLCATYAAFLAYSHFEMAEYLSYVSATPELYDDYYMDARDVAILLQEKKRNLVFIFAESMETTFTGKEYGGALEEDVIEPLTNLALDNVTFSEAGSVGGFVPVEGCTYTMGALVGQTAGVPINSFIVGAQNLDGNVMSEADVLPGAYTIGDILAAQGYHQEFCIGSDGRFAGRASYFRNHGNYEVYDFYSAVADEYIPDYYDDGWWGLEDWRRSDIARNEMLELAATGEPFNMTILTVDTHFPHGHRCKLCEESVYDLSYSNVYNCSTTRIYNIVSWLKMQDFYENTTIVIAGDHLTMDSDYITSLGIENYYRTGCFTIINPADGLEALETDRMYTTLDIFPTTLAALGVEIEGDRLGLWTNFFSETPTLLELYDIDYLNQELQKQSGLYTKKLLYGE